MNMNKKCLYRLTVLRKQLFILDGFLVYGSGAQCSGLAWMKALEGVLV